MFTQPHCSCDNTYLFPVMLFVIIPLGFSIVVITASMLIVYGAVRSRAGASRKWSFGVGSASKLEQAVFWQCLFYVMAFYITWPIMFAVYLGSVGVDGPLGSRSCEQELTLNLAHSLNYLDRPAEALALLPDRSEIERQYPDYVERALDLWDNVSGYL